MNFSLIFLPANLLFCLKLSKYYEQHQIHDLQEFVLSLRLNCQMTFKYKIITCLTLTVDEFKSNKITDIAHLKQVSQHRHKIYHHFERIVLV